MNTVVKLGVVPKAKVSDEIRAQVTGLLEEAMAEAEAGQVEEILIIMLHPGEDEWSQKSSSTQSIVKWIGRLTMTINDWIREYRNFHYGTPE